MEYRVIEPPNTLEIFNKINKKYTKAGALLRGIRIRENLTQTEMAKLIKVTQSDISQMENGVRGIGRTIAKRIENLFDVNYKSFVTIS
jgi:transcriptional regulator with XRE-family HTH domain